MKYAHWIKSGEDDLEIIERRWWQIWYYVVCKRIFGRPLTFIFRDFYHAKPMWYHLVLLVILMWLGVIGNKLNIIAWFGILIGHLFG